MNFKRETMIEDLSKLPADWDIEQLVDFACVTLKTRLEKLSDEELRKEYNDTILNGD